MGAIEKCGAICAHGADAENSEEAEGDKCMKVRFRASFFLKRGVALLMLVAILPTARANDSAASSAAGGIQLKREPRISMAKEKLTISTKKVTVEYEFINESDQDITTEVAFPVPPYKQNMSPQGDRSFSDFRLWVNSVPKKYKTQAKGMLKGKDCSALLRKYGIDIASLGHYEDADKGPLSRDFFKFSKAVQGELVKQGLFFLPDPENPFPNWAVEKTYYWQQTFPAHKVLHVRHEYEPGVGFMAVQEGDLAKAQEHPVARNIKAQDTGYPSKDQLAQEIQNACVDAGLKKVLIKSMVERGYVEMAWIDYILVTANNWKRPIKSFELIVEKDSRADYDSSLLSFCWDGKVERVGQNGFRATATNFVPKADLNFAFFEIPKTRQ
jgi:hypothetical protein